MPDPAENIRLTIDGTEVSVARGTNLIQAAASVGIEIPYYCFHRHLSIAGNCRMCQVEIEGAPKLSIACNTIATDGMKVHTHRTSEKVAEAQRATLEFLLINHPLDCTVCDEAGHCKLQDYYYQYNAKASRFKEDKLHKVKALVLGPEVIFDAERCILCTRCVRFCQEITQTSELGVFERGGQSTIGLAPGKVLNNPLSGSVCDLCPVGALTHRRWRFNTRFWYTKEIFSICPGCSAGCNIKAAVRDEQILLVRSRLNSAVNKEWLCDEGRYGFERFQPKHRLLSPFICRGEELIKASVDEAYAAAKALQGAAAEELSAADDAAIFISPFLSLEEMWVALRFAAEIMGAGPNSVAVQLKRRELRDVEKILVSPDYAPNARAFELFAGAISEGDYRQELESRYFSLLDKVRSGRVKRILLLGDRALLDEDVDDSVREAMAQMEISVALTPRAASGAYELCQVLFPSRSINEKSGLMLNRDLRLQRLNALLSPPPGTEPEWRLLGKIAESAGKPLFNMLPEDERTLFMEMIKREERFSALSLHSIGEQGVVLERIKS